MNSFADGGTARLRSRRWFPSGIKRERGEGSKPEAAAAPATVSGEPTPPRPLGNLGRRRKASTREPGDLPSRVSRSRIGRGVPMWHCAAIAVLRSLLMTFTSACEGVMPDSHRRILNESAASVRGRLIAIYACPDRRAMSSSGSGRSSVLTTSPCCWARRCSPTRSACATRSTPTTSRRSTTSPAS